MLSRRYVALCTLVLLVVVMVVGPVSGATHTYMFRIYNDSSVAENTDAIFPTIRADTGDAIDNPLAPNDYIYVRAQAHTTQDLMTQNYRGIISFDTSGITDTDHIVSSYITIKAANTYNVLGSVDLSLIDVTLEDPFLPVAQDYKNTSFTRMASDINQGIVNSSVNTTIPLNDLGIANISKTGITSYMLATAADVNNTNLSVTWASGGMSGYRFRPGAYGTGASAPALYVTTTDTSTCPLYLEEQYNVTGDGTDEATKLQAAFDQAATNGAEGSMCKVIFPASKTIVFGSQLTLGNYTEIDGQNSVLKVVDGYSTETEGMLKLGEHNYVHDLKFDGNRDNLGSLLVDGIRLNDWDIVENCEVYNQQGYSIFSYRDSNWVIRNNFIHDGRQYGIAPGGSEGIYSENVTISGNTVWNMSQVAIKIRGTGNSTVDHNNIIIPGGSTFTAIGIQLYSNDVTTSNVVIRDNVIQDDILTNETRSGNGYITGIGSDTPINTGGVIRNNSVNSTYYGIRIASNSSLIVSENQISNSRHSGLYVTSNDNTISDNILTNAGIIVGNTGKVPTNNTFSHNIVSGGNQYYKALGHGAFLWYGGEANVFSFNTIVADEYGLYVNQSNIYNTSITSNTITASTGCIFDQGTGTVEGNNTCNGAMDPLIVKFTGTQTVPSVGKKQVVFTDTSTGPTVLSRIWTAKNVTGNDTAVTIGTTTPLTVVFGAGNYSIVLNASAAIEANSTAENVYWVNVSASDSSSVPIAAFTVNTTVLCYGATAAFTDQSTNASSWAWTFGDGATSTEQNPEHTYNISSGYFNVGLTVSNGLGTDTETKTNYIEVQGSCSGGGTTPTTRPFSSATGQTTILAALSIIGTGLIVFGAVFVYAAFKNQSTAGLTLGIFVITLGAIILIMSYAVISPIMNLV